MQIGPQAVPCKSSAFRFLPVHPLTTAGGEYCIGQDKKSNADICLRSIGGGRWIRTTEVSDNRFTVCPIWPLWNSPI